MEPDYEVAREQEESAELIELTLLTGDRPQATGLEASSGRRYSALSLA
jgi:hypothetical protein